MSRKPIVLSEELQKRQSNGGKGLECPLCGCRHFLTTHTEPQPNGSIRRRKECRHCAYKIVTFEGTAQWHR